MANLRPAWSWSVKVRARTLTTRSMRTLNRADHSPRHLPIYDDRPKTRSECGEQRPCPYVSCKYHLYLDVNPESGHIKLNFPGREVWELEHTCALDLADAGARSLDRLSEVINITRERARQILEIVFNKVRDSGFEFESMPDRPEGQDIYVIEESSSDMSGFKRWLLEKGGKVT